MSDKYNSKIASWIGRLNKKPEWAVTISSTCTLYSVPESQVTDRWHKHENCHKSQFVAAGSTAKFLFDYAVESAKNGYDGNKYEIAARLAALG